MSIHRLTARLYHVVARNTKHIKTADGLEARVLDFHKDDLHGNFFGAQVPGLADVGESLTERPGVKLTKSHNRGSRIRGLPCLHECDPGGLMQGLLMALVQL